MDGVSLPSCVCAPSSQTGQFLTVARSELAAPILPLLLSLSAFYWSANCPLALPRQVSSPLSRSIGQKEREREREREFSPETQTSFERHPRLANASTFPHHLLHSSPYWLNGHLRVCVFVLFVRPFPLKTSPKDTQSQFNLELNLEFHFQFYFRTSQLSKSINRFACATDKTH